MAINAQNLDEAEKKYNVGGSDWIRVEEGDNKVRIIDTVYADYGSHFDQKNNKSYTCIGKDKGCPFCKKGNDPRVRYLVWAIDKNDGEMKKLEFGHSIAKQLATYANDEEYGVEKYGFPYWINIKRKGTGLDTEYNVIAGRKEVKLTDEQIEDYEAAEDLHEFVEKRKDITREDFNIDTEYSNGDDDEDIPVIEDDDDINSEDIPF